VERSEEFERSRAGVEEEVVVMEGQGHRSRHERFWTLKSEAVGCFRAKFIRRLLLTAAMYGDR